MKSMAALLIGFVLLATNPATFKCDQHEQTFIKNGTEVHEGKCYDVYTHSSPKHRVLLACNE